MLTKYAKYTDISRYYKYIQLNGLRKYFAPELYKPYIDFIKERKYLPLNQYRKYLTLYRTLLLSLLLPGMVMVLMGGTYRKLFIALFFGLLFFTVLVELLLFVFQFTRRENLIAELILLLLLVPVALVVL